MEDTYVSTSASTSCVLFTIFLTQKNAKVLVSVLEHFLSNDEIHNVVRIIVHCNCNVKLLWAS